MLCGMDGRDRKCLITLGGIEFTVACSAAWNGDRLHIWVRPLNSVAGRKMTFRFRGRQVFMQPKSAPDLSVVSSALAPYAADWIPNPLLGVVATTLMERMSALAEPLHVGIMR